MGKSLNLIAKLICQLIFIYQVFLASAWADEVSEIKSAIELMSLNSDGIGFSSDDEIKSFHLGKINASSLRTLLLDTKNKCGASGLDFNTIPHFKKVITSFADTLPVTKKKITSELMKQEWQIFPFEFDCELPDTSNEAQYSLNIKFFIDRTYLRNDSVYEITYKIKPLPPVTPYANLSRNYKVVEEIIGKYGSSYQIANTDAKGEPIEMFWPKNHYALRLESVDGCIVLTMTTNHGDFLLSRAIQKRFDEDAKLATKSQSISSGL